jgi:cytochrome c556
MVSAVRRSKMTPARRDGVAGEFKQLKTAGRSGRLPRMATKPKPAATDSARPLSRKLVPGDPPPKRSRSPRLPRFPARAVAAAILVGVLGCGVAGALAQDKRAIVQERRAAMKAQGAAMGGVKHYVDGEADQNAAARSAGDLVKLARGESERFPPGTSTLDFPGESGAKPLIWSEWGKFLAATKTMLDEALKLELAVKSGNKAAAADQLTRTSEAGCAGCHRLYREKVGLPF